VRVHLSEENCNENEAQVSFASVQALSQCRLNDLFSLSVSMHIHRISNSATLSNDYASLVSAAEDALLYVGKPLGKSHAILN